MPIRDFLNPYQSKHTPGGAIGKGVRGAKVPKPLIRNAPIKERRPLSQRDAYAKAMGSAQRRGGSNGIGIGY